MEMEKQTIRILGIDPGISALGWCVADYDPELDLLEIIKTGKFESTKVASKIKALCAYYNTRMIALSELEKEITKIVNTFKPDYCACEDAFYNPLRPSAFVPLTVCINGIETTLFKLAMRGLLKLSASRLRKYAPKLIKKHMSGNGTSLKTEVSGAIFDKSNIVFKYKGTSNDLQANSIKHHETDAIGCVYTFTRIGYPELILEAEDTKKAEADVVEYIGALNKTSNDKKKIN